MVETKKACVIYTPQKAAEASAVAARLTADGFAVCLTEVTVEVAQAVKASDTASLPPEVAECLDGAEVCVIVLEENEIAAQAFGGIGAIASDSGCRVVTVGGEPEALPAELDDIIDGHVASANAPQLVEIGEGLPERVKSDNTSAAGRKEKKLKCQ